MTVYKYIHTEDLTLSTMLVQRAFDSDWLSIDGFGDITVKGSNSDGYAWDGCSPKVNFLDLIIGTPDGRMDQRTKKPMTYYASMVHDCLYQYKGEVPITRLEADRLFRDMLKSSGFMWWRVYYLAVRAGGWVFGGWKQPKK